MLDIAQPKKTRESMASFIERAPTSIGKGPDAVKRAAVVLVHQLRDESELNETAGRGRLDTFKILRILRQHWLPRCSPPLAEDELYDMIEEAIGEIEADKSALKAQEQKQRNAERA